MGFVLSGMKHTFGRLALGLALGAAAAGCHSGANGAAAASSPSAATVSPTRAAATPSPSTGSPTAPNPTATAGPATATGSPAAAASVGVVADCASAEPFPLSTKPPSIVLACADDGVRVEDLTWADWTATAARGHGTLLENQCVPDCAEGKFAKYPVTVALFAVQPSSKGPWFSRLTLTWGRDRPPNQTPSTFTLEAPGSPPMPA
jgi:hypothetical protein